MASCTDFGTAKHSLSCLSVFCSVLIKFQSLLNGRLFQSLGVEVFRFEHELPWVEQLRADKSENKLFQRHAVVLKKAAQGKGKGGQYTKPADLALAHDGAQAEVHAHGHRHRQQGEDELPQGEAEEQAFLIVAHFLVDADFQVNITSRI